MYKVGDVVWVPSYSMGKERLQCPVCFGTLQVTVILGNGDQVAVDCDYCGKGFEGPKGYVEEYRMLPEVEQRTITKRIVEDGPDGEEIEYRSEHSCLYPDKMFDTQEEALAKTQEMIQERELEEERKPKHKVDKSYSWNVGYYQRQIAQSRKELERYEKKMRLCKAKSKE